MTRKNIWLIILFAIIHAFTALYSGRIGLHGGPSLTACTLLMIVILCYRGKVSMVFATSLAIITCFVGFIMGKAFLTAVLACNSPQLIEHTLPTVLSTFVLGFLACYSIDTVGKDFRQDKWTVKDVVKMVFLLALFLGLRTLMTNRAYANSGITEMDVFKEILGNSATLTLLLLANVAVVVTFSSINKKHGSNLAELFLGICVIAIAVLVSIRPIRSGLTSDMVILLAEGLVAEISILAIISIVYYSFNSRKLLREEKDKRHIAEFKYSNLKQQVNPHFLFNSLNVLYGLMYEDNKDGAMAYTQKLASLYRYILETEEKPLVSLETEMEFTGKFIDMLSVRHQNAFRVHFDVKDEDILKQVPPCSVQSCVENIFKHNTVTKTNPIEINIYTLDDRIYVKNNIIPKRTEPESTHVGLNYVKKVYKDLGSEEVIIDKNDKCFTISLPLL